MPGRREWGLGWDDNVDLVMARSRPILLLMYHTDRRLRVYLLIVFAPIHPHLYPDYDV